MEYVVYIIIALLIVIPTYLFVIMRNLKSSQKRAEWISSQRFTTFRIDVPKNNDKKPLSAEQMFASIHGIYSDSALYQNHLSFEIVAKDKYIQFYVHVPHHLKDFVEGQIYAQYPTVEIREVDDYSSGVRPANFASCELKLTKPDVYPIKSFDSFDVDPLSGITSVMSKLNSNEEIWFQLLIRPVGDEWQERGSNIVSAVRAGKKPGGKGFLELIFDNAGKFLKALVSQAFTPGADIVTAKPEVKLSAAVEEALKGIETKITKLGFETKIRILCIADDPITAGVRCQSVGAAFKQFNTTNLNGFKLGEISKNNPDDLILYKSRDFVDIGSTLNINELASIYHLPNETVETPNIVWSGSKKGEPPANLPLTDNTPQTDLTVIGATNFRNVFRSFGIKREDRKRHIYIVGKSGTGKSTLIENMAVDDVATGRGVIVVDPHGELADKVLACVPNERIQDVIVFDPADRAYPIAFNLLEHVEDDFKGMVASGFVGIFKKIFGDSWGPRLEHILRNTVLALLDFPDSTMLDIPRMLTDNRFRDRVVEQVKDPVIREFWVNEFAQYDSKFRTEAVSPILNKVGQFLATATIRNIVGQSHSRINIREIMDNEKILIINLSRGKIGEDNSALLGAMIITKVQLAAMSRADTSADKRPDCFLYVDEFQNFATDSFGVILSEARKYNLALTMANQYIEQMPETVRSAVFGNAGTIVTFRVGGGDADFLVKEFEPVFDANDLVNLDKYNIYIKLLVDGISSPAFSARTFPPVQKVTGNTEAIINYTHETYSSARAIVEEQINSRSKEEENSARKEAEIFKSGGLEALLKARGQHSTNMQQNFSNYGKPISSNLNNSNNEGQNKIETQNKPLESANSKADEQSTESVKLPTKSVESNNSLSPMIQQDLPEVVSEKLPEIEDKKDLPVKEEKPRILKYQNIVGDKIYKEQTARGGIKWYVGEEIDLEKSKEMGIIVPSEALKMIELNKRIVSGSQQANNVKKNDNSDQMKRIEDEKVEQKNDELTKEIDEVQKNENADKIEDKKINSIENIKKEEQDEIEVKSKDFSDDQKLVLKNELKAEDTIPKQDRELAHIEKNEAERKTESINVENKDETSERELKSEVNFKAEEKAAQEMKPEEKKEEIDLSRFAHIFRSDSDLRPPFSAKSQDSNKVNENKIIEDKGKPEIRKEEGERSKSEIVGKVELNGTKEGNIPVENKKELSLSVPKVPELQPKDEPVSIESIMNSLVVEKKEDKKEAVVPQVTFTRKDQEAQNPNNELKEQSESSSGEMMESISITLPKYDYNDSSEDVQSSSMDQTENKEKKGDTEKASTGNDSSGAKTMMESVMVKLNEDDQEETGDKAK